jgi:hypothetical protein
MLHGLDPDLPRMLDLRSATTSSGFMALINFLCNGIEPLSWEGTSHIVMTTFDQIIPYKDRELLLSFRDHLEIYTIQNPDLSQEMVRNLYSLRNYFLMKEELHRLFLEKNEDGRTIEEALPTQLLENLGLTPLFPYL